MPITTINGSATTVVNASSPLNASDSSPPSPLAINSMIAATAPVATPQNTTVNLDGSILPRSDKVPITMDAASAPETKKMPTRIMTNTTVIEAIG